MPFSPCRLPALVCANVGNDVPADPWQRCSGYMAGPAAWVHACDAKARALGFPVLRFSMPGGALRGVEIAPVSWWRDADAEAAFFEVCRGRTRDGLLTQVYSGRVHEDGTTAAVDNPATVDFFARCIRPAVAAGMTGLGLDNTERTRAEVYALAAACRLMGLAVIGEGIPAVQLATGSYVLTSASIHQLAWVGSRVAMANIDPRGVFSVNPAASELRVEIDDWEPLVHAMPEADVASMIASLKRRGFVVDQVGDARSGVTAAIVAQ